MLPLQYYEALNLLFRVENTLRIFVFAVLKASIGEGYGNLQVGDSTLAGTAKNRRKQEATHGYMSSPAGPNPLMYLTFAELQRLILSKSGWPHLRKYFPMSQNVLEQHLDAIGVIRNALAHFRPIDGDRIDSVRLRVAEMLPHVESCVLGLLTFTEEVPHTLSEEWFLELAAVQGRYVAIEVRRSGERAATDFVACVLRYRGRVLARHAAGEYSVSMLITPAVLGRFDRLKAAVVCGYDEIDVDACSVDDEECVLEKCAVLVLSLRALRENLGGVTADLARLVCEIDEDSELGPGDHARLVRALRVKVRKTEIQTMSWDRNELTHEPVGPPRPLWSWDLTGASMTDAIEESSPVEYWTNSWKGEWGMVAGNFISHTWRFPWIPADVS